MTKKQYLAGVVLAVGILGGIHWSYAAEVAAPMADKGKMMLEHIGMDCTICHGVNGPKGIKMGNHPKQQCTDCHVQGTTKALPHKEKRTSIAREMMLKHGAVLNCKLCHGEHGPKEGSMMLEHVGMDCQTCHVVEER